MVFHCRCGRDMLRAEPNKLIINMIHTNTHNPIGEYYSHVTVTVTVIVTVTATTAKVKNVTSERNKFIYIFIFPILLTVFHRQVTGRRVSGSVSVRRGVVEVEVQVENGGEVAMAAVAPYL